MSNHISLLLKKVENVFYAALDGKIWRWGMKKYFMRFEMLGSGSKI